MKEPPHCSRANSRIKERKFPFPIKTLAELMVFRLERRVFAIPGFADDRAARVQSTHLAVVTSLVARPSPNESMTSERVEGTHSSPCPKRREHAAPLERPAPARSSPRRGEAAGAETPSSASGRGFPGFGGPSPPRPVPFALEDP